MVWKEFNQWAFPHARMLTYAEALVLLILAFVSADQRGFDAVELASNLGFLAFAYISFALLVTPLRKVRPTFSLNPTFAKARRAAGVSAFVIAALHYLILFGFFFNGNLDAIFGFNANNGNALVPAYGALLILFLLALTSTDYAVRKLGKKWFRLHKLAYLAYPFIAFHAWRVGNHFKELTLFSGLFFFVFALTLLFELLRLWKERFQPANSPM
ncbi:ferric reductase-like transmembrane domain-containing protein [Candidatus Micrarchaeota archaeon]|nr:ferric reductase-like transmembrane domain-containing protein [Candidatus Micrarchaeota archaeon]